MNNIDHGNSYRKKAKEIIDQGNIIIREIVENKI
jgi:adenylate kinase family enzyme